MTKIYAQEKKKSEEKEKKEVQLKIIVCIVSCMDTLKADLDIMTLPTNSELTKIVFIAINFFV